ncbi:MAG TPA: class I SAM-dependent methyltransferase [Candidatus Angelobacter sp.]|nr:class I SAM-dependent methyltransferase [Candidatus Angelobacter sp.]
MDARECYDELADQYHLIFENWDSSIERQAAVLGPILERECGPSGATRILDCACGIGTQALGLAKLGFRVTGWDVSPRAVERARLESSRRGAELQLSVASMLDLTSLQGSQFDAVICMDNALPHLENTDQLIQAAAQIRIRLRPKGLFMASIRDYDRLIAERPATQGPSFYSDHGHRRIVFQVWDWMDDRRYIFHLYITREIENRWQTFHACATYRAVLRDELAEALERAGFINMRWLFTAESGFYQPIILAEAG